MTQIGIAVYVILSISCVIGYAIGLYITYRTNGSNDHKEFKILMTGIALVTIDVLLIMEVVQRHIEKYYLIPQAL